MRPPATVFFRRSLREDARQVRTYVVRGVLLLGAVSILALAQGTSSYVGAPGQLLFMLTAMMDLGLMCVAAPTYFASVIIEEKEAGTLGLLKMTGLKPVSILLGKSTSQLLGAVMLLLVQVPASVLAVTLGGVSLQQVFAGYLTMLAFLLFMGNLGLLFSVVCQNSMKAGMLCAGTLGAFFFVPLLELGFLTNLVREASPFDRIQAVMTTGFSGPLVGFHFWSNLALAGGCFLVAWAAFERCTLEQVTAAPLRVPLVRRPGAASRLGAGRAWTNALAWKDFNFIAGGKAGLLLRLVLVVGISALALAPRCIAGKPVDHEDVGSAIVAVSLFALFIESVRMSAGIFGEEHKWQTLSAIMALPRSRAQIVRAKLLGCSLGLLPYVGLFVFGGIVEGHQFGSDASDAVKEVSFWFVLAYILLLLHLTAYISLVLKRGAVLMALGIWLAGYIAVMVPMALLSMRGGADWPFCVPLVVALVLVVILQRGILRRLTRAAELE